MPGDPGDIFTLDYFVGTFYTSRKSAKRSSAVAEHPWAIVHGTPGIPASTRKVSNESIHFNSYSLRIVSREMS